MKQANKKGIWFRPSDRSRNNHTIWIANTVITLLTYVVLAMAVWELTGFIKIYEPWILFLTGGYVCLMQGILIRFQSEKWLPHIVLVLVLAVVLIGRQQILEGAKLFWNQLGMTWTANTGKVIPELEVQATAQMEANCLMLFSVAMGCLLALLCSVLVFRAATVMALVLPGILLVGMIFLQVKNALLWLLLAMIVAIMLLVYGGWGNETGTLPVALRWITCLIMTAALLAATTIPAVENWISQSSQLFHKAIHEHRYETSYTTLPEGNFTNYLSGDNAAQSALVVNMEIPEELYLRGFTGVVFENDTWKALDTEVLAENKELLYWMNLNGFNPSAQFEAAASFMQLETNTVTVQNIGACSQYYYVPFNLCSGAYLQERDLNTDSIHSDGERIYMYSTVSGGAKNIRQVLMYLQNSDEQAVLNYRKAESVYRDFVYNNYLQISETDAEQMGKEWDAIAAQYGVSEQLTLEQAQTCTLAFLNKCFPEEETQEELDLPLKEAKGSSFQYATVAALTLRHFGIPARYAEGYIVTEELASSAESGSSIAVDSGCAGAWVEVYQDGIGWIPMDLTPGLEAFAQDETDGEQGNAGKSSESDNPDLQEGEELEEEPETKEESQPNGGYMVIVPQKVMWSGLLILLFMLLVIVFLVIRRNVKLARKKRSFCVDNKNDAIAWIFADSVLLLKNLGFDRGNGSVQTLCEPVRQHLGGGYEDALKNAIALNAQAMFSSYRLEECQRQSLLEFHDATLAHLKVNIKWYRRLWLKWFKCLY